MHESAASVHRFLAGLSPDLRLRVVLDARLAHDAEPFAETEKVAVGKIARVFALLFQREVEERVACRHRPSGSCVGLESLSGRRRTDRMLSPHFVVRDSGVLDDPAPDSAGSAFFLLQHPDLTAKVRLTKSQLH